MAETEHMLGLYRRLRWAALVAFVVVLSLGRPFLVVPYDLAPVYLIATADFLLNLASYELHTRSRRWRALFAAFLLTDVGMATAFIHFTGGLDSPFNWVYITIPATATVVGSTGMGWFAALTSTAAYAADLWAEFRGWLPFYHPSLLSIHVRREHYVGHTVAASIVVNGILLLGTNLLLGLLYRQIEERRQELAQAYELRSRLLHQAVTSQEEERKRIARELHDEIGQTLTVLGMSLGFAERNCGADPERVRPTIKNLETLANRALTELQRIIYDLRPSPLDDLGLAAAVRSYLEMLEDQLELDIDFHVVGEERRLPGDTEIVLFRAIQEGLTNAIKHAHARHVEITLAILPERVVLTISDDGLGFDFDRYLADRQDRPATRGMGLVGMRERLALLGGNMAIHSQPGHGTRLEITVPLTSPQPVAEHTGKPARRDAANG